MALAVHRMKKSEIVWAATHRCDHGHTFLAHPQCYKEGRKERIGFFDIEIGGSGFTADGSFVLCYCILNNETGEIVERLITPAEIRKYGPKGEEDRDLLKQLDKDLRQFDRVITYNGVNFDTKFCRTRALMLQLPFPTYGTLKHTDVYFLAKSRLSLRRKSQEMVAKAVLGPENTRKNHFDITIWRQASRGCQKSLDMILDHCRRDIHDLRNIYHTLLDFGRPPADTSL